MLRSDCRQAGKQARGQADSVSGNQSVGWFRSSIFGGRQAGVPETENVCLHARLPVYQSSYGH